MATTIRVAHSPDSDDAFMFYALATGKVDTEDIEFIHELQDIETLNRRALAGELEVTAVSIHAYAYLSDKYALLLEIDLEHDEPFAEDHCGTCSNCVTACPTQALLGRDESGAPIIDARRCISYLTIELRGPIPTELRPLIGTNVFGCDICQEVCPWNSGKFVQLSREQDFAPRSHVNPRKLIELMGMNETEWDAFSQGSAIRRARRAGFLRNVAVALGNWGSPAAAHVLTAALRDLEPLVRGHAAWALGRIDTDVAREALRDALTLECDAFVRDELMSALGLDNAIR